MESKIKYLIFFVLGLLLFSIFSAKVLFHDAPEYITIAKNFAGVNNVDLFSTHSLLYPLIISPFLKIWPSLTMLKIVNCMWVFLIGLTLFLLNENKKAFVLFVFSPLTWYVSIQTSPILPASFCFLLSFLFLRTIKVKYNLFYSGIFLGLSYAFYDPMLFIAGIFILVYFWNKRFYNLFAYLVSFLIGLLPRFLLDYYLFDFPFYSMIRFFGTNMIITLGLYPGTTTFHIFENPIGLLGLFIISPFLFKIYKAHQGENKRDFIFVIISFILILTRCAALKYFLMISPVAIIIFSKYLTKKEINWHIIISVLITIFLVFNFFTYNYENKLQEDLNHIIEDRPEAEQIISGEMANAVSVFLWADLPKVEWYDNFKIYQEKQGTKIRRYEFDFNSKLNLRDSFSISANFDLPENKSYENYIIVSSKNKPIENREIIKCYEVLCVYEN